MLVIFASVSALAGDGAGKVEIKGQEALVDVRTAVPGIVVEIKYTTAENFMKKVLYDADGCFLRESVAAKLKAAQEALQKDKLGIKIFDGYRPHAVQKIMFARYPQPGYVADPKTGSNHNRGAAVDVTLVDAAGKELPMPSDYDEFSERAHVEYIGASEEAIRNRAILQNTMKAAGFKGIRSEWWHFDDPDSKSFEILDFKISELVRRAGVKESEKP